MRDSDEAHRDGFFDRASDLLCVLDPSGRFARANPAWTRALGWSEAELRSFNALDLLHPADRAAAWKSGMPDGRPIDCPDGRYRHRDGGYRAIEWRDFWPSGEGFGAVARDVTEGWRPESLLGGPETDRQAVGRLAAALLEAEANRACLVSAVEALPDGFALYNAEDRLVLCNERYREFYPRSADRIVPGVRFEEILRAGLVRGEYRQAVGREEEWLRERLSAHRRGGSAQDQHLADGRWVRVIEKETPDGGRVGMRADVTDLKLAERRLAAIIRGADAGTWEWNVQTGRKIYNDRWAEMIGMTLGELGPTSDETWRRLIHPEDLTRARAALERHFSGKAGHYECAIRLRHRDGRWIWVQDRGRVATWTADGRPEWMYGVHIDITARVEAEAALKASEERFRSLFAALPDGVALIDAETRRFVHVNDMFLRLLGRGRGALAALRVEDVDALAGASGIAARIAAVLEQERDDFETRLRCADGGLVPVAVSVVALREGGSPSLLAVVRDVSELRRQNEALKAAREAAEAASAAKSLFLANMSHEIRTPMNGVLGMAEVLSHKVSDPELRQMIEVIRSSGDALLTVLNDILDFSKIEAGRLTLEEAPFSPGDLADRLASLHGPRAVGKGIRLDVRIEAAARAARLGDSVRVLQILHNLVGNAVKFTASGGVDVTIAGEPGAALRLEVRDSGIGMTPEQLEHLFETFHQADNTTTRRFGGTGLGMSIVRSLTEMMKGRIEVESAPGGGTRVRVWLPLPAVEPAGPVEPMRARPVVATFPGLRVLAADDSRANRMVLAPMLASLGVEAVIVEGGEEAVLAAAEAEFDLMLLDISMPVVGGESALSRIRAEAARAGRPAVPALAVTANAFPHHVEAYLAAGFAAHVPKPLRLETLSARIAEVLARGQRPAA